MKSDPLFGTIRVILFQPLTKLGRVREEDRLFTDRHFGVPEHEFLVDKRLQFNFDETLLRWPRVFLRDISLGQ